MIAHDSLSKLFTMLAVLITLYLCTYEPTTIILFPVVLLLSGLMMQFYLQRKVETVNHVFKEPTISKIGYYTIIALLGITLTGWVVKHVPMEELTGYDAILYSVLIAIAEEQFFRGFITNFMLSKLQPMLAIIASAIIFAVYHLARYGLQYDAFTYVFAGGLVLSWVAYKSQRLSPCLLAHIINNIVVIAGVV